MSASSYTDILLVDVEKVSSHPLNTYESSGAGIEELAANIRKSGGLIDIPLARELSDGTVQMLSGHRRLAAYRLLSTTSDEFSQIPLRILNGVSDEQALIILHSANLYTRSLTSGQRRSQIKAFMSQIEVLREGVPEWQNKSDRELVGELLGTNKTIYYEDLNIEWKCTASVQALYDSGDISRSIALMLGRRAPGEQDAALEALAARSGIATQPERCAFLRDYFEDIGSIIAKAYRLLKDCPTRKPDDTDADMTADLAVIRINLERLLA